MSAASACLLSVAALLCACSSSPSESLGVMRGAAGNDAWRSGDVTGGRREYVAALREDVLALDEAGAVRHLNNAGVLDVYAGRVRQAEGQFAEAIARASGSTADVDRRRLAMQQAALLLRGGRDDDVRTAGTILRDVGLATWVVTAEPADRVQYWSLVSALLLRSTSSGSAVALEALQAAERAREACDSYETRAVAEIAVGRALVSAGSHEAAREAFRGALDAARRTPHPWLRLAALRGLARVSVPGPDRDGYAHLADELAAELRARAEAGAR